MTEHHVPRHIGIIMDGNNRWSKKNNKKSYEAYSSGAKRLLKLSSYIFENYEEGKYVDWVPYSELPFTFKIWTYDELKELEILDLPKEDRKMMYASVEGMEEGTAYKAGLRQGDVFLEINGKEVYGPMNIIQAGLMIHPGETMTVKVKRGDEFTGYEELEFSFVVGEKDRAQLQSWLDQRNKAR